MGFSPEECRLEKRERGGGRIQLADWDFEPLPAHRKSVAEYKKSHRKAAVEDYMQTDLDDNDAGMCVCVCVCVSRLSGVQYANVLMCFWRMTCVSALWRWHTHSLVHRCQVCHFTDRRRVTNLGLSVCPSIGSVKHERYWGRRHGGHGRCVGWFLRTQARCLALPLSAACWRDLCIHFGAGHLSHSSFPHPHPHSNAPHHSRGAPLRD